MDNKFIAAALIAFASQLGLPAYASGDHAGHGIAQGGAAEKQMIDGQVKKVDKATGKITLSHGPLTNLNMPAMTMVFKVSNAAWLEQLKSGDKIRYMADTVNGALTLVHFEAAK